jgi:hypothetical protein
VIHADQLVGVRVRQGLQQHAVNDAEDRRVRADAEGEREDGGRRETGLLPQHANGVAHVLQEILKETTLRRTFRDGERHGCLAKAAHVPCERVRLAQLFERESARVGLADAGIAELLIPLVEVLRQLFDDLGFASRAQSQRGEARSQLCAPVRGPAGGRVGLTHGRPP